MCDVFHCAAAVHPALLVDSHSSGLAAPLNGSRGVPTPTLAGVSLHTESQPQEDTRPETWGGKFAGGGALILHPVPEATKRALDLSACPAAIPHAHPCPNGDKKQLGPSCGSETASAPSPSIAPVRPGSSAPPRVYPPQPYVCSNRSGTYCASAGRLPRPLSPR